MDTSSISIFINEQQRQLILFLLDFGLAPNQLRGDEIVMSDYYRLIITKACNGVIPVLLYISMVWAYPRRSILDRVSWTLYGYIVITLINVARILFVVAVVQEERGRFAFTHDIVGNFIFMVTILSLLALYIKYTNRVVR